MEKNGDYTGVVCGLGSEGEGIIKCDGTTAFVPYCLEGEEVVFTAHKVSGNIAYGKLSEVHTVSPDREAPECPVFEKCGGCQLQHMTYDAQLRFKRQTIISSVKKIAGLDVEVEAVVPSEKQYRYRNKLVLPVGRGASGVSTGFFASRSHRIVNISDCPIQAEWIRDVISALRRFMADKGIEGYDESDGSGKIRHIVVREIKGSFVVTVVSTDVINLEDFAALLDGVFDRYTLLLNVNASPANKIYSDEWHICKGNGFFTAEEEGIIFKAGADTFLQVNDEIRPKIYSKVRDVVDGKNTVALDLYSGAGLLTAMLAQKCGKAYGIEVSEEAHICAEELREMNSLRDKMVNICGKVEDKLPEVLSLTEGSKRVIVCDPPRKGMARSVVRAVNDAASDKIILISCSPATFARDLGILTGSLRETDEGLKKVEGFDMGSSPYEVTEITPFDMFPQTKHVEIVCVLERKG
ncbi:MAG: 23S rRNA (uracil(1939)-C(5))-methyltransferase RlmD [Clostridia bacterium]|nr:23S rRNA (uracil(1939)-C(5))-methyltransferase RlmD [Clostridia bacterium]